MALPTPTVRIVDDEVHAWGLVETPAGSRLQAVRTMALAVARAELSKFLQVRVTSEMEDRATDANDARIADLTREITQRALPAGGPPSFGWRSTTETITMVARIRVPVAALRQALRDHGDPTLAHRLFPATAPLVPQATTVAAWARTGDRETDKSFRFVCHGEGRDPGEATTTARAFCEDKICKLCGVEVESIVQSRETLSGVELSREVVERCRRVRSEPVKVVRQSVDCPEGGRCVAWIEVEYTKAQRNQDCKRYADERFADPAECEAQIDAFSQMYGYTAASLRARIDVLDRAIAACKDIDVRPTPLLTALDEKLRSGMARFTDEQGRAPRYLSRHWLASHPPTWDAYKKTGTFVGKLELLRGYLGSKPPILDIIEASLLPPERLDTKAEFARLLNLLASTSVEHGYDRARVHFFALQQVRRRHDAHLFHQPLAPLWTILARLYPPHDLEGWNEIVDMVWLAKADRSITDAEWTYFSGTPKWWPRTAQMLLAVQDHGSPEIRRQRFESVLARALREGRAKSEVARARRILPVSPLLLDIESLLPPAVRDKVFSFEDLQKLYRRLDDRLRPSDRARLLARMAQAASMLAEVPKRARQQCTALDDHLQFLEQAGADVRAADRIVCRCLTHHLADKGLSLVNKSDLYRRALDRDLICIRSKDKKGGRS